MVSGTQRLALNMLRKLTVEAAREADRAEAHTVLLRMDGFGGPAQPSPTIAQCLNGGYTNGASGLERFTGRQLGVDCAWRRRAQGNTRLEHAPSVGSSNKRPQPPGWGRFL